MYTVEELSPTKKRFRIEVPKDVIDKEISDAYSRLNRKVKVPGFRPGHVPRQILERKYSKDIEAEVIEKLVPDYYLRSVKESGFLPVDNPTFEGEIGLKEGTPLSFVATVEVRPVIDIANYEGIEVNKRSHEVSEEEVDRALKHFQESHARLEPFEESHRIEKGDFCVISFEGFLGDKPMEGANVQDYILEVGSQVLIPGFEEQLAGAKKGDRKDINATFPEDYRDKSLAGKEARFNVEVKEVKRKVVPELDDELAKDLGQNTLADLRALAREGLEKDKKRMAERDQKEQVIKKLIESHSFETPSSMVERELSYMIQKRKMQTLREAGSTEGFDESNLAAELKPVAIERVKSTLILESIGEKEGISISDEDLDKKIGDIASRLHERPEEIKKVYISRDGSLDGLRHEMFSEKVLDFLLSKAVLE